MGAADVDCHCLPHTGNIGSLSGATSGGYGASSSGLGGSSGFGLGGSSGYGASRRWEGWPAGAFNVLQPAKPVLAALRGTDGAPTACWGSCCRTDSYDETEHDSHYISKRPGGASTGAEAVPAGSAAGGTEDVMAATRARIEKLKLADAAPAAAEGAGAAMGWETQNTVGGQVCFLKPTSCLAYE